MPEDIRQEIIISHQIRSQSFNENANNNNAPNNNVNINQGNVHNEQLNFLYSMPSSVRQEILMTASDD